MSQKYVPMAGEHIIQASANAVALANEHESAVEFTFNGVDMVVRPGEAVEDVAARWTRYFDEVAAEYRRSERGQEAARRQAEAAESAKREVAALLEELPAVLATGDGLMRWLWKFTGPADHAAVSFDTAALADRLESAGYVENRHVGRPEGDFDDEIVMREYVVGQVINCLRKGMPPHPVTRSFVEKYADLPGVAAIV